MPKMWPQKEDVFGTGISRTSFQELATLFEHRQPGRAVTVNVCNVHSVMSARSDSDLAAAFAASEINTPDGMPLVWVIRSRGYAEQSRVNGTDLTLHVLAHGLARGWRHYFYGSTPRTLELLGTSLTQRFPGIAIAGSYSPPFRVLGPEAHAAVAARILETKPDIVWVGLGMPKQEKWMFEMRDLLPGTILVGIGAAFDFLAGTKPQAPRWMQDRGLEWAFRFASEPRRLWRRYLWNNPAYLALWGKQLATAPRRRNAQQGRP